MTRGKSTTAQALRAAAGPVTPVDLAKLLSHAKPAAVREIL